MTSGTVPDSASALPAGASCAQHPGVPAALVCERCGDYACAACRAPAAPALCTRCRPVAVAVEYYPVTVTKLVVLGIATLSFYVIYWAYRQWRFVAQQGGDVWPAARAIFFGITYYGLIQDIVQRSALQVGGPAMGENALTRMSPMARGLLAVGYFAGLVTQRLPDPYWALSFLSVLCLIPTVRAIEQRNLALGGDRRTWGMRWWQWVWATPVLLLLGLGILAEALGVE